MDIHSNITKPLSLWDRGLLLTRSHRRFTIISRAHNTTHGNPYHKVAGRLNNTARDSNSHRGTI